MNKQMRAEERKGGGGGRFRTKGAHATVARRPWHKPPAPSVLPKKNILFYFLFWSFEELFGILGEWVYNTPIF
jgi:hypothetical protein